MIKGKEGLLERIPLADIERVYKAKPKCKLCSGKGWYTLIVPGRKVPRENKLCPCAKRRAGTDSVMKAS